MAHLCHKSITLAVTTMTEEYPLQNLSLSSDPSTVVPKHLADPEIHDDTPHESAERLSLGTSGSILGGNGSSLAPVDRGFGAYSFLAGAFIVEIIVWGFPSSFGVILEAYLRDPTLSSQKGASTLLPLIGTLSSGLANCLLVIVNPLATKYPESRQPMTWIGGFLCVFSLLGASFVKDVKALVALQGVLYSIGGTLVYAPCLSLVPEWFVAKRGLALGVLFAGTAAGGLVLPLILSPLLEKMGPFKALRILSAGFAVVLLPVTPFIRGRLPISRVHGPATRSSSGLFYFKKRLFWILLTINTLQGLAYNIPLAWLPTFASALNLGNTKSSLTLSLLNGASLTGRIIVGLLSDRFNPWLLAVGITGLTSFITFILWGILARSFATLVVYSLTYGAIAAGWPILFFSFVKPLAKDDHIAVSSIFGYLSLTTGISSILSTPIATSLQHNAHILHSAKKFGFGVDNGRYASMIIFIGSCYAAAALSSALGWWSRGAHSRGSD